MTKIKLTNNCGKSWKKFQQNYIKGFAFIKNTLLSEEEIMNELIKSIKKDEINKKLLELNMEMKES